MDKPTKILIGGIVCASIIASGQVVYNHRLESHLKQIEAECLAQKELTKLVCDAEWIHDIYTKTGYLPSLQGGDIFDQIEFERKHPGVSKIQLRLALAYRKLHLAKSSSLFYLLGTLVVALSAVPWLWYFLLRRIRELHDAIVGK